MLKRHQASIDLMQNALIIRGVTVPSSTDITDIDPLPSWIRNSQTSRRHSTSDHRAYSFWRAYLLRDRRNLGPCPSANGTTGSFSRSGKDIGRPSSRSATTTAHTTASTSTGATIAIQGRGYQIIDGSGSRTSRSDTIPWSCRWQCRSCGKYVVSRLILLSTRKGHWGSHGVYGVILTFSSLWYK